ncbi:SPP1 phage holin family protein [Amphibacillus sediminis]|uniref:SPP1 phage holin family protein n=1 Tax=Amphibacillus sediminis TaxID=360185 RepID=UPI000830FBEF|nr:SPP1 phage holin family protein [Amphibacillus sediminis]
MNLKGVTKQTWGRVIALFLVFINQIGVSFFNFTVLPFADQEIYQGVSVMISVIVAIWTSWKNNSFTELAQQADRQMKGTRQND